MFKKAFSLLEVMLLIFIITLVLGIGIHSMLCYQEKINVKLQQEKISADLSWVKDYAKAKATNVDVFFSDHAYTLQAGSQVIKNIYLDKDFTVSPQHFGFTPAGTPSYSGTVYLYKKNLLLSKYTVAVASGLMHWQNLP